MSSGNDYVHISHPYLKKIIATLNKDVIPSVEKSKRLSAKSVSSVGRDFPAWSFSKTLKQVQKEWETKSNRLRAGLDTDAAGMRDSSRFFVETEEGVTKRFSCKRPTLWKQITPSRIGEL